MTPVSDIGLTVPVIHRCHAADDVAVALRVLTAGEMIGGPAGPLTIRETIPAGHKIALRSIAAGQAVMKYGAQIGRASAPVLPGGHVHSHNLQTALLGEVDYAGLPHPAGSNSADAAAIDRVWHGYRRADGRCATRNEIWVLPTVGCVALLAESVAREADALHRGRVDGIFGFAHPHGCSQLGDDLNGTRQILAALCDNPNAGGILLLGLGCESNQLDALLQAVPLRSHAKIRCLAAQQAGDERAEALRLLAELVDNCTSARREVLSAAELVVGLKCGGSDALSGLTANPLLGRLSDRLAATGGSLILTEIPEIFGAETALLTRAASAQVQADGAALLNRFKRHFLDHGQPVSENPSPGNIAGGITTLEEKSLGAVQKAGQAALVDVIDYGETAHLPGVTLLEAPGNDAVSSTALAAAGATMILFTTGRGTPLGFPVPTMKIASNSALANHKAGWTDFDAGRLLTEPQDAVDAEFTAHLLAIASGTKTAAERGGQRAIALWKRGVTL